MKFTMPRREDADRQHTDDLVAEDAEREARMLAQEQHDRDDHADERAVERHPALPDRDEVQRVREVLAQIVPVMTSAITKPIRPPTSTPTSA